MKPITSFNEYFCLEDDRGDFEIETSTDSQLIFGAHKYKEGIDNILSKAISVKHPPRLVWIGDFGTGKTHHISYTQHKIISEHLPFFVVRMEPPDLKSKSNFDIFFCKMLEGVGFTYFREILESHVKSNVGWLDTITPPHVKQALQQIANNKLVAELAWGFLCGNKLTPDEASRVGVTKIQINDSEDFGSILKAVAQVVKAQTEDKKMLLFLIDEGESLQDVDNADAQSSWVHALRKILDVKDVGVIFAIAGNDFNSLPPIILDGAIVRRFGNDNFVMIQPYEQTEALTFLKELFQSFVDPAKKAALEIREDLTKISGYDSSCYPFTPEALEGYTVHLTSQTGRSKPAEFVHSLNDLLNTLKEKGKFVVDRAFLEDRGKWH